MFLIGFSKLRKPTKHGISKPNLLIMWIYWECHVINCRFQSKRFFVDEHMQNERV